MQLEDLIFEWLHKAKQDITSARFLVDMHPRPLEVIGFHAQQAAEKSLKALLVRAGVTPPRTHDLVSLHQMCAEHAEINLGRAYICARLTPYAVEHRYPVETTLSEDEVLEDLGYAEELHQLIREKLDTGTGRRHR